MTDNEEYLKEFPLKESPAPFVMMFEVVFVS